MALNKQSLNLNFAQGLDTKTDPFQVAPGKMLTLQNTIFDKGGMLQKRNGHRQLALLPDTTSTYVTTYTDNLLAVGSNLNAYLSGSDTWVTKGAIEPLSLSTLSVIRSNTNQSYADSAISSNGLLCTVFTDQLASSLSTPTYKYAIADVATGQNVISPTVIPVSSGVVTYAPKVFTLGRYFIIMFTNVISATPHLQFVAININNPSIVSVNADISSTYTAAATGTFDAYVANDTLYVAWNASDVGGAIRMTTINSNLQQANTVVFPGFAATHISVTADTTGNTPTVYTSFYGGTPKLCALSVDQNLLTITSPTQISANTAVNVTSAAQNGTLTVFYERPGTYAYDTSQITNRVEKITFTSGPTFQSIFSTAAPTITASSATGLVNGMKLVDNTTLANIAVGTTFTISGTTLTLSANTTGNSAASPGDTMGTATVSSSSIVARGVGLASKAFIVDGVIYFLSVYGSNPSTRYGNDIESTYFLLNGSISTAASPRVVAKLAYSNGHANVASNQGYLPTGLPNVVVSGTTASVPYLIKDLVQSTNKGTNLQTGVPVASVYSQLGVNVATFSFGTDGLDTSEIGGSLNLSGGFLWNYDGYLPVENNFFLWPDMDTTNPTSSVVWSTTGGSMKAQPDSATNINAYFYQVTYEWADNHGLVQRSAPSLPIAMTTTASGTTGSATINVPTLRLTYKTANPVKIVIYRWSVAQQSYFQVTSINSPVLNDTTVDYVTFVDTLADTSIVGNNLLYTTGNVVENVNGPASNLFALFDTRLWLVDAEDPNLLWFSKQVLESTPVEMSDLFTLYVAPTTAAQGSTGPITALSVMDDKLIIFKKNAIYYVNGIGPDNTGANNQYSQPIFITSTVGCDNQNSIIFTPAGLMFQSDKGIWLLGRDTGTTYIGAPVQDFNNGLVLSAVNVPATNQVRFTLDTGVTLMYDYYYSQWGTFTGIPGLSNTVFQGLSTFINSFGQVFQESVGTYLDGSNPVLMKFTSAWLNLASLQGYQRIYEMDLLGVYYSPHKLVVQIAYDYNPNPTQQSIITPSNYSPVYGLDPTYGSGTPYGGMTNIEQWKVHFQRQTCQSFQITISEIYDPRYKVPAGVGLTLSGLNCTVGIKKSHRPLGLTKSVG